MTLRTLFMSHLGGVPTKLNNALSDGLAASHAKLRQYVNHATKMEQLESSLHPPTM